MDGGKGKKGIFLRNKQLILKTCKKLTTDFFLQNQQQTDAKHTSPIQNQQPCTEITLEGVQRCYMYQEKSYHGENASLIYRERLCGSIIFF